MLTADGSSCQWTERDLGSIDPARAPTRLGEPTHQLTLAMEIAGPRGRPRLDARLGPRRCLMAHRCREAADLLAQRGIPEGCQSTRPASRAATREALLGSIASATPSPTKLSATIVAESTPHGAIASQGKV
jgi:hypothetical protein